MFSKIFLLLALMYCVSASESGEETSAFQKPKKYVRPTRPPSKKPAGSSTAKPEDKPTVDETNLLLEALLNASIAAAQNSTTSKPPIGNPLAINPGLPPEILAYFINEKRSHHGAPPVRIDPSLTSKAQKCADFYQASKTVLDNDPTNFPPDLCDVEPLEAVEIFGVGGRTGSAQVLVLDEWYKELESGARSKSPYNYRRPNLNTVTEFAHALQLVWKSTTLCGCAISDKGNSPPDGNDESGNNSGTTNNSGGDKANGSNGGSSSNNGNGSSSNSGSSSSSNSAPGNSGSNNSSGKPKNSSQNLLYVHVCVCDQAPSGRAPNYIRNVLPPKA